MGYVMREQISDEDYTSGCDSPVGAIPTRSLLCFLLIAWNLQWLGPLGRNQRSIVCF